MAMVRRAALALVVAAISLAGSAPAWAHAAGTGADEVVARPPSGGLFGYTAAEATPISGEHATVHYVRSGLDAPPLNDDDANGLPDYVEQAAAAADAALAFYAGRGFRVPPLDLGGPDGKPDIYIKRLPIGILGGAIEPAHAEGGSFVVISPQLDRSTTDASGSVSLVVAHELFHIVQYAYVAGDYLPTWVAEGTANAVALRVFPGLADYTLLAQLGGWLLEPWRSLFDESLGCDHCYGGAWWWLHVDRLKGNLIGAYFQRLAALRTRNAPIGKGLEALDATLRAGGHGSLQRAFSTFALSLYRLGLRPGIAYWVRPVNDTRITRTLSLAGLSTHYVRVHVPEESKGVVAAVPNTRGPRAQVTLVLGGPKGRMLRAKPFRHGEGAVVAARFRSVRERRNILLVITSGRGTAARYRLAAQAVGPAGRVPGWVAWPSR
jgi:hypothetical protein